MAKKYHSIIQLQGTLGGLVFVYGSKYGNHVRFARGTIKKASCNDVLLKNASRTSFLNLAISPVYHFLKSRYTPFMSKEVWLNLLSRVRRSESDDLFSLMKTLEGLELHHRYPFANLANNLKLNVTSHPKEILVDFATESHPLFKRAGVNCYYYDITVLFRDGKGKLVSDSISTEWVHKKDEAPAYELAFKKPAKADCYLLLMKVSGGHDEKEIDLVATQGVQVVKVGEC